MIKLLSKQAKQFILELKMYGMSYIILTGFFVLVFLFDKDPFFVATPLQNTLILLECITVFVIWVLYAKSRLTVIVPFFMSLGPLAERFLSTEINEDPFYITLAIILGIPVMIGILYFMFRKRSAE